MATSPHLRTQSAGPGHASSCAAQPALSDTTSATATSPHGFSCHGVNEPARESRPRLGGADAAVAQPARALVLLAEARAALHYVEHADHHCKREQQQSESSSFSIPSLSVTWPSVYAAASRSLAGGNALVSTQRAPTLWISTRKILITAGPSTTT